MITTDELLRMKEKMKNLEEAKSQAEGRLSQLMENLKSDFGFKDEKKAQESSDKEALALSKDNSKLEKEVEKLRNDYDWDLN